jgi:hypothetical protein
MVLKGQPILSPVNYPSHRNSQRGSDGAPHPIRSITCHTRGENNTSLCLQLNEHPRRSRRAIPRPKNIQSEQLLHLRHAEIQRWLMSRHSCIGNHAIESSLCFGDGVDGFCDALFVCDICLDVGELVWVLFLHGSKVFAGAADVEGVDFACRVCKADFCEAEPDTLIRAGDCESLVQFLYSLSDG